MKSKLYVQYQTPTIIGGVLKQEEVEDLEEAIARVEELLMSHAMAIRIVREIPFSYHLEVNDGEADT